jgi:hypothetical protein
MHNVLCRSVTIEARFTASSRSSRSHRDWTDLYRASYSRVRGALWKALYVQNDDFHAIYINDVNPANKNKNISQFRPYCRFHCIDVMAGLKFHNSLTILFSNLTRLSLKLVQILEIMSSRY